MLLFERKKKFLNLNMEDLNSSFVIFFFNSARPLERGKKRKEKKGINSSMIAN